MIEIKKIELADQEIRTAILKYVAVTYPEFQEKVATVKLKSDAGMKPQIDLALHEHAKGYALGFQEAREAAAKVCEGLGNTATMQEDMNYAAGCFGCGQACRALEPKA